MRAMLLAVVLLCGGEMPANVKAYKDRCEAQKLATVVRMEKSYEAGKKWLKDAASPNAKVAALKQVKEALASVKEAGSPHLILQRTLWFYPGRQWGIVVSGRPSFFKSRNRVLV